MAAWNLSKYVISEDFKEVEGFSMSPAMFLGLSTYADACGSTRNELHAILRARGMMPFEDHSGHYRGRGAPQRNNNQQPSSSSGQSSSSSRSAAGSSAASTRPMTAEEQRRFDAAIRRYVHNVLDRIRYNLSKDRRRRKY